MAVVVIGVLGTIAQAAPAQRAEATAKARRAAVVGAAARAPVVVSRSAPSLRRVAVSRPAARAVPSIGQQSGLHATDDELALRSAVALVVDRDTDEVLFSKNARAVLPIASITKLMTALVVVESGDALAEPVAITADDVLATAGGNNRRPLAPGARLTRAEMLQLALMASENRAAHALGRSHPAGLAAFVAAMNAKARELGMRDTRYVEPTGLSSENRSSAEDLARLVRAAAEHPIIREYSTATDAVVANGRRQQQFRNTNGLVRNPEWEIAVQKTGYIAAAGRCVVMQAQMAGRQLIMVLLDSAGRYSRIGDAERLRHWLFQGLGAARAAGSGAGAVPVDAPAAAAAAAEARSAEAPAAAAAATAGADVAQPAR
ncbi:MAG: serine hydrolase [Rubrivivax sp.]|nr:serine hydrolase [Rubrivivax sp.]